MEYVANPKHKEPWQRGRRGSLCPTEITPSIAADLLERSEVSGQSRYANYLGRAYRAFEDPSTLAWHGFPVAWVEVPQAIWQKWLQLGEITRSDVRKYWTEAS